MKAARFYEHGGPEVLRIEDIPRPTAAAGQVVIEVAATSFNPIDAAIRSGVLTVDLPTTPGLDVAGVVVEVGENVDNLAVGTPVVGYLPRTGAGAAAEYVTAPAGVLTAAPTSIPLADAAALPLVGLTAWQAVFEHGELQPDQRVLVNGAGGAVGCYAVQLAVNAGAEVIATASASSVDRVRSYGAAKIVDHTDTALSDGVGDLVDLVINTAPTPFAELLGTVRPGGRIVSATTPVEAGNDRGVTAIRMASRSDAAQLARLVSAVDNGTLQVWVGDRRPLEEIAAVHAGRSAGKTILLPK